MLLSPHLVRPRIALSVAAASALLAGCGGGNDTVTSVTVANASSKCTALAGAAVPAGSIGLPTQGAVVTSSALQAADAATGTPEYCKVLGSVMAVNASDPPINFEVNLPTTWNLKALQYGGGGLNGSVITSLAQFTHGPTDAPTPLAKGYVTLGGDSGHQAGPLDGTFGLNAQALANYSGESVKRTHDAAKYLVRKYYEVVPRRIYHIGGSKGGHEGLVAAQRYASDYDGVVAYYPASQNPLLVLSWRRMWLSAYNTPGGAMNAAKQALLKSRVLAACDALDGAADGIVSNTQSCETTFNVASLRCPSGADEGDTCLSDTQIATLNTAASAFVSAFPMANAASSIGPYPVFLASNLEGSLFDNPKLVPLLGEGKSNTPYFLGDPVVRMWYRQDPNSSFVDFDYRQYQTRIQQISSMYDSSNPALDAFTSKGGKLILVQGTNDMAVPQQETTAYYDAVRQRYGQSTAGFLRYFVQPGFGHAAGDYMMTWDSLTALENWAERGQAPESQVTLDINPATRGRTRPLCEYPLFPKYKGSGDVNSASSYACSAS